MGIFCRRAKIIGVLYVALFLAGCSLAHADLFGRPNLWNSAATTGDINRSSGNVGIGSNSPTQKLDVVGTVKAITFLGNVTGDVTGNVTGNITGNGTGQFLNSVADYGTSTSSSTARNSSDIKVVYGTATGVGANSSTSITNLPFTSASTYVCIVNEKNGDTDQTENASCVNSNGSTAVIWNNWVSGTTDISYIMMGI